MRSIFSSIALLGLVLTTGPIFAQRPGGLHAIGNAVHPGGISGPIGGAGNAIRPGGIVIGNATHPGVIGNTIRPSGLGISGVGNTIRPSIGNAVRPVPNGLTGVETSGRGGARTNLGNGIGGGRFINFNSASATTRPVLSGGLPGQNADSSSRGGLNASNKPSRIPGPHTPSNTGGNNIQGSNGYATNSPGNNNPTGNNPGGSNPGGNNVQGSNGYATNGPGNNNPTGNNPGGSNPGGNNVQGSSGYATNSPGNSNPTGNNPGGNNPGGNNSNAGNNPGGNNSGGGSNNYATSDPGRSKGGAWWLRGNSGNSGTIGGIIGAADPGGNGIVVVGGTAIAPPPQAIGPATAPMADAPAEATGEEWGMKVVEVRDKGAAQIADLRVADIIVGLDGKRVQSFEELTDALAGVNGSAEIVFINGENSRLEKMKITPVNGKLGITTLAVVLSNDTAANDRP